MVDFLYTTDPLFELYKHMEEKYSKKLKRKWWNRLKIDYYAFKSRLDIQYGDVSIHFGYVGSKGYWDKQTDSPTIKYKEITIPLQEQQKLLIADSVLSDEKLLEIVKKNNGN